MHVLILGAAGMIGRKLTARLVADGHVGGRAIERLTLADVVAPEQPAGAAGAGRGRRHRPGRGRARPNGWSRAGPT